MCCRVWSVLGSLSPEPVVPRVCLSLSGDWFCPPWFTLLGSAGLSGGGLHLSLHKSTVQIVTQVGVRSAPHFITFSTDEKWSNEKVDQVEKVQSSNTFCMSVPKQCKGFSCNLPTKFDFCKVTCDIYNKLGIWRYNNISGSPKMESSTCPVRALENATS